MIVAKCGLTLSDFVRTIVVALLASYLPELQLSTVVMGYLLYTLVSKYDEGWYRRLNNQA